MDQQANVYRIKVTLKGSRPPIWRRIEVTGDTTLGTLHDILQVVMGWTNSHLHGFRVGRDVYGAPDPSLPEGTKNELPVRLDRVAAEGKMLIYDYDYGDNWEHLLKVEKVFPPKPGVQYPRCLGGKRAGPPEDCGGIHGYRRKLMILDDPDHRDHVEIREWLGEDFDPDAFDVARLNERLAGFSVGFS